MWCGHGRLCQIKNIYIKKKSKLKYDQDDSFDTVGTPKFFSIKYFIFSWIKLKSTKQIFKKYTVWKKLYLVYSFKRNHDLLNF